MLALGVDHIARLTKVLALAESDQDGEALAALRAAQHMLAAQGMTLEDLVLAAATPLRGRARHDIDASRGLMKALQSRLAAAEDEINGLRKDLGYATRLAERWKALADTTLRDTARHQAAADKWRALARRTADHLWDLGQQLQAVDDTPTIPVTDHAPESVTAPETKNPNVVRFFVKKR